MIYMEEDMTPTPDNLKLLGWFQFAPNGVWVSPIDGQRYDSFEKAWKQAMADEADPAKRDAPRNWGRP